MSSKKEYDLLKLKTIPIIEVCGVLGITIERRGNKSEWIKIRNERTASCKLYTDKNTYCDFGDGNAVGGVTELTMKIKKCDRAQAIDFLCTRWGFLELGLEGATAREYKMIGIEYDKATKNFDIDIGKYGIETTQNFVKKYDITVGELKIKYPQMYKNMIQYRAVPAVHKKRAEYLENCLRYILKKETLSFEKDNTIKAIRQEEINNIKQQLQQQANELIYSMSILNNICKKEDGINYKSFYINVEENIKGIQDGKISVEFTKTRYADKKKEVNAARGKLHYLEMGLEQYYKIENCISDLKYSGFYRVVDGLPIVKIACTFEELQQIKNAIERKQRNI